MRIARYVVEDQTHFGVIELDIDQGEHPNTVAGVTGDPLAAPVRYTGQRHDLDQVRLLSPVIPRSKIVGIGRNFVAHADELGNEVPKRPLCFFKPNTSVIGPGESIVLPEESNEVHFEGELAIVIGRMCKQVPVERVQEVIFGFVAANDVTARDLQQSDGQWARAKGFDTFCPVGPWIATHLSLSEAQELQIQTRVNGDLKQDGSTSLMVHDIASLVTYVSSFTTLLPGDLILTGTPAGVGPLVAGDEVSVTIDQLGTLTNPTVGA